MPDLSKPERTRRRIWLFLSIPIWLWFGTVVAMIATLIIFDDLASIPTSIFELTRGTFYERIVAGFAARGPWILFGLGIGSCIPALAAVRLARGRAPSPWMIWACRAMSALGVLFIISVFLIGVMTRLDPDRMDGLPYDEAGPLLAASFLCTTPALLIVVLAWLLPTGRDPGQCRACGYNLAGVESDKCSECGAPRPGSAPEPPRRTLTLRRIAYTLTIHALALLGIVIFLNSIWPAGRLEREAVEFVKGTEAQIKRLRESRGNTGLLEHFYRATLGNDGSIFLVFDKADRLLELRMRPPGAAPSWIFTRDIDYPERWVLDVATLELDPQTNTFRTISTYLDNNADGMPEQLLIAAPHDLRIIIPPIDLDPTQLDPSDPDPTNPD